MFKAAQYKGGDRHDDNQRIVLSEVHCNEHEHSAAYTVAQYFVPRCVASLVQIYSRQLSIEQQAARECSKHVEHKHDHEYRHRRPVTDLPCKQRQLVVNDTQQGQRKKDRS